MGNYNLNFNRLNQDNQIALHTSDMKHCFVMNVRTDFKNSNVILDENNAFLFDGYSVWFHGAGNFLNERKDFTVTIELAPMSFESGRSGLLTKFNQNDKKGFYIAVGKLGIVTIGFGNGVSLFEFASIKQHLNKYKWNVLTVVFNSTAGWCDLYINGNMSNRKQFPRHELIKFDNSECYIGKYINQRDYVVASKNGIFDGYLKTIEIYDRALTWQEVIKDYIGRDMGSKLITSDHGRNNYLIDKQRPQYHLIAPMKWMNEPHGPMFFKGFYHIFYQANPHAPLWDNIQWGHQISEDMVHWRDLPLALETEDNQLDPDGCWSGSSIIDKQGIPTIFYTAGNNIKFPNQGIAMAKSVLTPDNQLEHWVKENHLIVEQTQQDGWMGEFRDPFVWLEDDNYYMLVGTGDANNGGGNALLYSSTDLIHWSNHGFIMDYDYDLNTELGHVWELPVLLPLKDETGKILHHILLLCACQIEDEVVETYYWIGDWNRNNKSFHKLHDKAGLIDLGNGTFTGPSGFVTPDGRSILFTLAQGKRASEDEFHSGWAHNGGLPIELFYRNNQLGIKPIREIYALKHNKLLELNNVTVGEVNNLLNSISGDRLYASIETYADYIGIVTNFGNECVEGYYDKANNLYAAKEPHNASVSSKLRGDIDRVSIGDEPTKLEYFLDHSMIEVYLNQQKSITLRDYSKDESRSIRLIAQEDSMLTCFSLWEMRPIY